MQAGTPRLQGSDHLGFQVPVFFTAAAPQHQIVEVIYSCTLRPQGLRSESTLSECQRRPCGMLLEVPCGSLTVLPDLNVG